MHPGTPEKSLEFDRLHKASLSSRASTAQLSEDSSSSTIPRAPITKRNRRRSLQRTFSASDLIREAASTTSSGSVGKRESSDIPRSKGRNSSGSQPFNDHDADTLSTEKSSLDQVLHDSSHGSVFLDEIMFLQQLEQKQFQNSHGDSVLNFSQKAQDQRIANSVQPPPSIPKHTTLSSPSQSTHKTGFAALLPHPFFVNQQVCQQCSSLTAQVENMHDDLEYMRKLALHREGEERTAAVRESMPATLRQAQHQQIMPTVASTQLVEITTRQKKQIEQLMKERVSIAVQPLYLICGLR
jgi:hypothetical protein